MTAAGRIATACRHLAVALGSVLALLAAGRPAAACGSTSDCTLREGSYRVATPERWDGRSPLPVALYFHGWQQSAADVMAQPGLVAAFSEIGVLLVAVNGLDRTWTFPGSPSQARDDVAVALSVLDDVERRFPVDTARVWATGFSQGGSMVWWLACQNGARFAAFAPVAGAFWEPMRETCGRPADIMHIHGVADGTVPMAGRSLGGRFRQGDVLKGLRVWRQVDGCREADPSAIEHDGDLECQVWRGCASGRELRLCLHAGGHEIEPRWIATAWRFVLAVARRRSATEAPHPGR